KWTPASIKSFTCTMATHCPPASWRVHVARKALPGPDFALPLAQFGKKGFIVAFGVGKVKGSCPVKRAGAIAPVVRTADWQPLRQPTPHGSLPGASPELSQGPLCTALANTLRQQNRQPHRSA